jgi:hypothetical protein
MGLDTSHNCWNGSYSAFNRFREALCEAAEVRFRERPYEAYQGNWEGIEPAPTDPLEYLINHSDCEGILPLYCLVPLADRLEGLLPEIKANPSAEWGHLGQGVAFATERFIKGLREAACEQECVEFH